MPGQPPHTPENQTISARPLADQLNPAAEVTPITLEETNRLYKSSRHINAAQSAVDVYQALIDFARDSDLVDAAYIISSDADAPDHYTVPALWSRRPFARPRQRFPRDKFPFGENLTANKLILIRNSQTDPQLGRAARRLARINHLRALVLIPIQVEEEYLATLALQRTEATLFTETELQPFLTLVDQSAVILLNQRLLNQAKTLYQVGQSLSQALTIDDALNIAVQRVAQYTGASQCRFVLYDLQAGVGTIAAEYIPTDLAETARFPVLGDCVVEYLGRETKPLLLDNQSDVPPECIHRYLHRFGAAATLLIPAISQQDLMGFLTIESRHGKRPFRPGQHHLRPDRRRSSHHPNRKPQPP